MSVQDMDTPVTIVSGTNRGVGFAIAQAIAARSTPQILYAGSRAGKELGLKSGSPRSAIHYVKLDIADSTSIASLADRVDRDTGRVDRLINNAGINVNYKSGMSPAGKAKQTMDVNYRGTLEMNRRFLPLMRADARIINVSSVASHLRPFGTARANQFRSCRSINNVDALVAEFEQSYSQTSSVGRSRWPDPYSVSKACINAMTRVMARENPNVLINCCCPGWCNSDMGDFLGKAPKTAAEGAKIPLHLAFADIGTMSGEFWEEPSVYSRGEGRVSTLG
ncbi:MAG: hypothetical protein TREMPRED_001674 [Tremellales sp. Tagirdzhanova-0007]|nr:MAG: hypothetical protein TREMPRED_001674 [Tremellales sp. Tagirdzhanova-0007]